MRIRFKASPEQRAALRAQLARLLRPSAALAVLDGMLPDEFDPGDVDVAPQSSHPDRFVVRVDIRSVTGERRAYALKAYSDDFAGHVWQYCQALAQHHRPNHRALCLPLRHIAHERMLVFPWIEGEFLSDVLDARKPERLREAARLAAELHRLPVVPERATTAQMFVEGTLARCERLTMMWPEARPIVQPLADALQQAAANLDRADLGPVHGDLAPGQFLVAGDRLVLLDFDMFGYADPAYDVGHFLAQLERRAVVDLTVRALTSEWFKVFRDAYLTEMPNVSPRNVAFYRGLTLISKMYTVCRRDSQSWREPVRQLAQRAHAAFDAVGATAARVP